ncbi:hypothetical protein BJX61DRAFT_532289 [Aspergillus egyptiacus]|nr:hypothetical protein BJX61DRAFT_532289 [Aspergillus egyptiacus]
MHIIILGTLDTKHDEVLYLHNQLHQNAKRLSTPLDITLIDCGAQAVTDPTITISQTDLISRYSPPETQSTEIEPWTLPRGRAIELLSTCASACVAELLKTRNVHGIVGAGGSCGTSLIAAVMRNAVPIGLPKLIVSTVASGNTGPVVGECDITMMYSVVDIAGGNRLLRDVLGNAAGAMVGMAAAYESMSENEKTRVGITMFGVTTPCVDTIRSHLESTYPVEVYVFHATGHGGKAMERLVRENHLDAIIDLTTTEICDLIAGGEMACDESRLETSLRRGIPNIISVGATDMVNFGPVDSVPERYKGRKLYKHNPSVTLMRTDKAERKAVGEFIVEKVKRTNGGPFEDQDADKVLLGELKDGLIGVVRVVEDERDVNDAGFAVDIANRLMALVERKVTDT